MAISFRARLYIGFALAIVVCAISGVTSSLILHRQDAQRIWVREARRVLDSTNKIQTMIVDMETGRRGFRATNQKRFLEPYSSGLQHISPAIAELKNLLSDDSGLSMKALLLEQRINTLIAFWKHNGDNAEAYTREYITKLTDDEKKQMDEIRAIITGLQKDETKLLSKRREEYDQLLHYANISSIIDSFISEAIIFVLIIIIFREFRSRRKAQEQLHDSVEQLKQQADALHASEAELIQINKQLERFVYIIAHDIKNPLSGIIGTLSLLQMDETIATNPELAKFAELSSGAAIHLSDMVGSLLEYSKISLAKQIPERVDTKELLERTITLLFPPRSIQILLAEQMPVLNTRKLKIQQVFQNLISNAIKYNSKEKGLIEVGYADKEDHYEFYVKDNGQGIVEDDKDAIFTLLKTGNNKSSADSSTGFGLNIVKLIVEEQGGKIWYDSVPGEGSTFYFEWRK